jgi:phosphoglycerol transferase MdoB-like AlkP superfamily enzyme
VKGIEDYEEIERKETKFTDLYNIPLMIYDKDLIETYRAEKELQEGERNVVDKYVCTADITTTVLDLLGIRYYENLYFGNSIFEEESSVLYSRAYNNFLSSGIISSSVKNVLYQYEQEESMMETALEAHKAKAEAMVDKIKHCDYIFRQDYFGNANNLKKYHDMMAAAQNAE